MQEFPLCEGLMQDRSGQMGPIIEFLFRNNKDIDRNAEGTEQTSKAYHFVALADYGWFDNQKIDV